MICFDQLAELPTFIIVPIGFVAIFYYMVGMNSEFTRFVVCCCIILLVNNYFFHSFIFQSFFLSFFLSFSLSLSLSLSLFLFVCLSLWLVLECFVLLNLIQVNFNFEWYFSGDSSGCWIWIPDILHCTLTSGGTGLGSTTYHSFHALWRVLSQQPVSFVFIQLFFVAESHVTTIDHRRLGLSRRTNSTQLS